MKRNRLYYLLREYFSFTRSERNGIVFLMTLIMIALVVRFYLPQFLRRNSLNDGLDYEADIRSFAGKSQADTVVSVMKLNTPVKFVNDKREFTKKQAHRIDINRADSVQFTTLPGIGPVLAGRIIKYRKSLGGFMVTGQLSEVYGLQSVILAPLLGYLTADTLKLVKMKLNSASFKEINAHPYISFEKTKALVSYRRFHRLNSYADLELSEVFSSEELKKIRPYLQFE